MRAGAKHNDPLNKKGVVMVFGTFDLLHQGHISFLAQARKHGEVVAVVARGSSARKLKNRKPHHSDRARLARVLRVPGVLKALLGDKRQGAYSVIKKTKPQIICLGYDQRALEQDLRARIKSGQLPRIKIVRLKAHKPKKFKTSIVAKRSERKDKRP